MTTMNPVAARLSKPRPYRHWEHEPDEETHLAEADQPLVSTRNKE